MRRSASQPPRAAPQVRRASSAYCEHVGSKRHDGSRERGSARYSLTAAINARVSGPDVMAGCPGSCPRLPRLVATAPARLELAGRSLPTPARARRRDNGRAPDRPRPRETRLSNVAEPDCAPLQFPGVGSARMPRAASPGCDRPRTSSTAARCRIDDRGAVRQSRPCCGTNRSGAQPLPALASASVHNRPTRTGGHAMAEAVAAGSSAVMGLVRALHAAASWRFRPRAGPRNAVRRPERARVSTREHRQPTGADPFRCAGVARDDARQRRSGPCHRCLISATTLGAGAANFPVIRLFCGRYRSVAELLRPRHLERWAGVQRRACSSVSAAIGSDHRMPLGGSQANNRFREHTTDRGERGCRGEFSAGRCRSTRP